MSWACSATSQDELVRNLRRHRLAKHPRALEALAACDRATFCESLPYEDAPQTIGYGATISAPHMHAIMIDLIAERLVAGARCLDIGAGSGIICAMMGELVAPQGSVWGIEHIGELVAKAQANLRVHDAKRHDRGLPPLLDSVIHIVEGDGRLGLPAHGPYDVIHVGAMAEDFCQPLVDQLAPGGRMLIPTHGSLWVVDKDAQGGISHSRDCGVVFVPLTSVAQQRDGSAGHPVLRFPLM